MTTKPRRHKTIEVECEYCRTTFESILSRVKEGKGRFCTKSCYDLWIKENSKKEIGIENGRKYWNGERWIIHWYDENKKIHTLSYQKWWWLLNVGDVPHGYVVRLIDDNPNNLEPSNFDCVEKRVVSEISGRKSLGRKFSEESRKLMSKSKLGKMLSPEHRANIAKSVKMRWERGDFINTIFTDISGDKNPGWRGGAGQEYPEGWNRKLKKFIWERDNSVCQICGRQLDLKGTVGHVHHIDGDKDNIDYDNLILLCQPCHTKIHKSKDTSSPIIMAFRAKLHWNQ